MDADRFTKPQDYPLAADGEFDLRHYLLLLWDRAWLILLLTVLAGVSTYFISRSMTPIYQTTTKLLVVDATSNNATDYSSLLASERLTSTYSDMLTNEAVLQEVIKRNGLSATPSELVKTIKAAPVRDTQLILVTVTGANPRQIAKTANTLVQVLVERVDAIQSQKYSSSILNLQEQLNQIEKMMQETQDKINNTNDAAEKDRLDTQAMQYRQIYANLLTSYEQTRLAEAQTSSNIMQVNEAQPPLTPVYPKTLSNTLLAVLIAVVVGVVVVFALDLLDDSFKTPAQVTTVLGLPVLGVIFKHTNGSGPISEDQPRSQSAEAFRTLRTNIQYVHIDEPLTTLLVTSPSPKEGKTQVSANLASVLAQDGRRVILIDADLRRPSIHSRLSIFNKKGLTSMLLNPDIDLNDVGQKSKTEGLTVITSGDIPPNPAELLGSRKMGQVLENLRMRADILVLDTPPVLPVADTTVLATMVDGVLLVIQPGLTSLKTARQAVEQLRLVKANILGVVVNNVEPKISRYNYYYHRAYPYDAGQEKKAAS